MKEPLIFQQSVSRRRGFTWPADDLPPGGEEWPAGMSRDELPLPEVSELQVIRHFTRLSHLNYGVDSGPYPLGSCTMKYNPRVLREMPALEGWSQLHPYQPCPEAQGALGLLAEMQGYLAALVGLDEVTLQPAAGAHAELTGMLMVRAWHRGRGETQRQAVLIPDSAHGTNPASAARAGFQVVQVDSNDRGRLDLGRLKELADGRTAALMLTNPNTLGLWEEQAAEAAQVVHDAGGLVYYDGANLNALLGRVRPGDLGFDLVHFNLHKTFAAPHGGGGPGAGPLAVRDFLAPYLPRPVLRHGEAGWRWDYQRPQSIGRVRSFYGNFGVILQAYAYLRAIGREGLRRVSAMAVLNANYLRRLLQEEYRMPYPGPCLHEFVMQPGPWLPEGLHTLDIAKRLMDYGFHPPTIYFPLIVQEAIMVEPTETESRQSLEELAGAFLQIARESRGKPDLVSGSPFDTAVGRLDEVQAARRPVLRWEG